MGVGVTNCDLMQPKQDRIGIDSEDWDEVLRKVEISYAIKFRENELAHIRTLGELIEAIDAKVIGTDSNDCTTQQAFYRIRTALATQLELDPALLRTNTRLEDLVPRQGRRRTFRKVEAILGVKLHVFRLKPWITMFFIGLFLGSLTAFIWSAQLALLGLAILTVLSWSALATTRELSVATIGELAERTSQRAYKLMRRNYGTVNRKEIKAKLKSLFQDELGLDDNELRDDILIAP